jgi:hypothetical protein
MSEKPSGIFDLEDLWDALLSRQNEQVLAAFHSLDENDKAAVITHLQRMAGEPGWLPDQRVSAQAALTALDNEA